MKQCSSSNCDWFFIDKTKNQNKQWYSMQLCGNREKARKFYKNKKIDIEGVEKW
ncbi:CGNR zinc finger domain-containing protein [Bacillus zhangzhouensis]|uniref:CGNR zinc finger domain-containing protein n=1 Tax=Bacillus zhangzhouensis TaxID=1178540 RepID=UPI003D20437F